MLYRVGANLVEVCGELFPAANIQVYNDLYPIYLSGHMRWYGFYWEMMFENGRILEVSQNLPEYLNGDLQSMETPSLEECTIEMWFSMDRYVEASRTNTPDHAWFCPDLKRLAAQLKELIELYSGTGLTDGGVIVQSRGTTV